jgi:phosphate transport system protein
MSLRVHYEEEITAVNREILALGQLAENALAKAMSALRERSPALAGEVIADDIHIDRLEDILCDRCSIILAREQPVAGILRHLVSVLRIIPELERIGDHAAHIAQKQDELCKEDLLRFHPALFEMSDIALSMLRDALTAFVEGDPVKALETAGRDLNINRIHKRLYTETITYLKEHDVSIEDGVTFLFTSRYLERLGDHIKNICEWVVFSTSGEFVDL